MYLVTGDIFKVHEQIKAGKLIEKDKEYHDEIAKSLMNDYQLAINCFTSCSVDFYQWFAADYLYKLVDIIKHHRKKELLLLLKNHLLEEVNDNHFDRRISSIDTVYHVTYSILR